MAAAAQFRPNFVYKLLDVKMAPLLGVGVKGSEIDRQRFGRLFSIPGTCAGEEGGGEGLFFCVEVIKLLTFDLIDFSLRCLLRCCVSPRAKYNARELIMVISN